MYSHVMFAPENVSIYLSGPTGQKWEHSGCGLPVASQGADAQACVRQAAKMAAPRVPGGGADALPHKEKPEARIPLSMETLWPSSHVPGGSEGSLGK